MSHEVETMAFIGDVPWHGLGVEVPEGISPEELLNEAGLNWKINKQRMWTGTGLVPDMKTLLPVSEYFALVRDIDDYVLGICGKGYVPFQNSEVFKFFERYCSAGKLRMNTAGSLQHGRMVWALAKVNGFVLGKDDLIDGYLLLCQPHIWGKALIIMYTSVRVVCMNTLNMALNTGGEKWHVPHIKAFDQEIIESIGSAIGLADERMKEYKDKVIFLSTVKAERAQVLEYVSDLFQPELLQTITPMNPVISHLELKKAAGGAFSSVYNAPGSALKSAQGTWWGAFNGVTYYLDHLKGRDRDLALQSNWFGKDARIKNRALELAVNYAKVA